jgi:hypothetical protein
MIKEYIFYQSIFLARYDLAQIERKVDLGFSKV